MHRAFHVLLPVAVAVSLVACAAGSHLSLKQPSLTGAEPIQLSEDQVAKCFGASVASSPDEDRPLVAAVISPHMVYSLLEWPRMQREAEAAGYRVQSWRDPRIAPREWASVWRSKAMADWNVPLPAVLPESCAPLWGSINHEPLVRVVWQGRLHPWPAWGVMTQDAWIATLNLRRAVLMSAPPHH